MKLEDYKTILFIIQIIILIAMPVGYVLNVLSAKNAPTIEKAEKIAADYRKGLMVLVIAFILVFLLRIIGWNLAVT